MIATRHIFEGEAELDQLGQWIGSVITAPSGVIYGEIPVHLAEVCRNFARLEMINRFNDELAVAYGIP